MKKSARFLLIIFGLSLFAAGCNKAKIIKDKLTFTKLKFDQQQVDFAITPESDLFKIGFHRGSEEVPDDYVEGSYTYLRVASESTAEIGKHFTITNCDLKGKSVYVTYNKTETTGDFELKVFPSEITEPVTIVIFVFPYEDRKMTINLLPAE